MSNNSAKTSGGISVFTIIFLILMTLKLAEIGSMKDCSWFIVTAPLWVPFTVIVLFIVISGIISIIRMQRRQRNFRLRHGINNPPKSKFQIRLEEMETKRKDSKNTK